MIRGLYTAASGMMAQISRQEIYANNLANANSVGFRRGQVVMAGFDQSLAAAAQTLSPTAGGVTASAAGLDLTPGNLLTTQRPLDVALAGPGFFTLQAPQGPIYTRDGRFSLDARSRLIGANGALVLGANGPLTLPPGEVTITAQGEVFSGGKGVGRLQVVQLVNPQPVGQNCYSATRTEALATPVIVQGSLEQSNVNPIREVGRMTNGYRLYEANATALRQQDQTLESLLRTIE
jgi:flagellar basal-body rod protein FlgG